MSRQDDSSKELFDDGFDDNDEEDSSLFEEENVTFRDNNSKSTIQSVTEYLGKPETFFHNYFDLEGGNFPDLFTREYRDTESIFSKKRNGRRSSKKAYVPDDCDSTLQMVSTSRALRLYSDLLTASLQAQMKAAKTAAAESGAKFDEKKFMIDSVKKALDRKIQGT